MLPLCSSWITHTRRIVWGEWVTDTVEGDQRTGLGASRRTRRGPAAGRGPFSFQRLTIVVLVIALVVVGFLTWASQKSYNDNENRLLGLKAKEVGAVLTAVVPSIQTPLATATQLADASAGSVAQFDQFMGPLVGPKKTFVSASLWRLNDIAAGPIAVIGARPDLADQPALASRFLSGSPAQELSLTGILRQPVLSRLGYAYRLSDSGGFAAYAEGSLPTNRRAKIAQNSAFSDLHYALYAGKSEQPANLIASDLQHLPVSGRHQSVAVPFGNGYFTLDVAPRGSLSGALSERLPWIIGIFGTLLAVMAALITEWLVRRRHQAEALANALDQVAHEREELYNEQRSIAQKLQQALLPEVLPDVDGIVSSCRYVPGTKGMEVGGDWYDLVPLGGQRAFFVVGDVSGRGLQAAAVMARLRYAVLAYAQQGDRPDVVLAKLSHLLSLEDSEHFATVLCGVLDVDRHEVVIANAGHLPCLVVGGRTAHFVDASVGMPIGLSNQNVYTPVTAVVPANATLLAFTDGLVERRGEAVDASLERLSDAASVDGNQSLDRLLASLVDEFTRDGIDDDAAILGVRWQN